MAEKWGRKTIVAGFHLTITTRRRGALKISSLTPPY
jgi:hypothetical protein